jgi:prolipoprotein diacylglyceryltransferase
MAKKLNKERNINRELLIETVVVAVIGVAVGCRIDYLPIK